MTGTELLKTDMLLVKVDAVTMISSQVTTPFSTYILIDGYDISQPAGQASVMPFEPGEIITRRYLRGPWITWAQPMRVISDDEAGLLLWHPAGSEFARLVGADGNTQHEVTVDRMRDPRLTVLSWSDCDIL